MTCEEIYTKYIGIFKVLMKNAGIENGNQSYKNVDLILDTPDSKKILTKAIEDEVDFRIFVVILIFLLISDIHGMEKLQSLDSDERVLLVKDMYQTYLEFSTRKFCTKHGLPVFSDPEISCEIFNINKD